MNNANRKCPACGVAGKPVKTLTLRSLLRPEKKMEIADKNYLFCGSPGCDLVYFSEDGSSTFAKNDLTVRVGVKENSPPRPVCYCFDHSIEGIFDEVERTGRSTVVDDIRMRIQEEGCSCETKNPQGGCCLGTVESVARAAHTRFGKKENGKTAGGNKECCGPGDCCK